MATKAAVNQNIALGTPWTVPAGFYAIVRAFPVLASAGDVSVVINGVQIAKMVINPFTTDAGPLAANSGDIFSAPGNPYGISGFIFPNPV